MRYFRTNDDYLWYKWDGETLYFTAGLEYNQWEADDPTNGPHNINSPVNKVGGEVINYLPGDALYAYETDSEWNRL